MSEENKLSELSNEQLQKQFAIAKKLLYPSTIFLFLLFAWGIYAGGRGKMGFFLLILFMFGCFTCLKYIEKYSKLKKEMKSRNLLS